jgi:hypothetical protein
VDVLKVYLQKNRPRILKGHYLKTLHGRKPIAGKIAMQEDIVNGK